MWGKTRPSDNHVETNVVLHGHILQPSDGVFIELATIQTVTATPTAPLPDVAHNCCV